MSRNELSTVCASSWINHSAGSTPFLNWIGTAFRFPKHEDTTCWLSCLPLIGSPMATPGGRENEGGLRLLSIGNSIEFTEIKYWPPKRSQTVEGSQDYLPCSCWKKSSFGSSKKIGFQTCHAPAMYSIWQVGQAWEGTSLMIVHDSECLTLPLPVLSW